MAVENCNLSLRRLWLPRQTKLLRQHNVISWRCLVEFHFSPLFQWESLITVYIVPGAVAYTLTVNGRYSSSHPEPATNLYIVSAIDRFLIHGSTEERQK